MQLLIDTANDSNADILAAITALQGALRSRKPEDSEMPDLGEDTRPLAPVLAIVAPAPSVPDPATVFAANREAPAPVVAPPPPPPPAASGAPASPADSSPAPAAATVAPTPASTAAASFPADAVKVDKTGIPWDERIHANSKAMNANGTWRTRRNLADGVLEAVTAELKARAAMSPEALARGVAAATAGAVPPPPPAPVAAVAVPAAGVVPPTPPAPSAAVTPPPPPPAPAPVSLPPPPPPAGNAAPVLQGDGSQLTAASIMKRLAPATNSGKVTPQQLDAVLVACGYTSLQEVIKRPDNLAALDLELRKLGV